jgi:hypothetical protein
MVARPLPVCNAKVAAIFRVVEMTKPTLLMDEADTYFHDNDELRGILNAGHRKGGYVLRCEGDDLEPRMFSTWSPTAIAAIGKLPDTLTDRAVPCRIPPARRLPTARRRSSAADEWTSGWLLFCGGITPNKAALPRSEDYFEYIIMYAE